MPQLSKELAAFKACTGPFRWKDFARILSQLGYEQKPTGKTSGSRRKYYNKATSHLIMLDEPHEDATWNG
jgi:hypothetical protein